MKEAYTELKLEVIEFDSKDVIVTSIPDTTDPMPVTGLNDSKAPDTTWSRS